MVAALRRLAAAALPALVAALPSAAAAQGLMRSATLDADLAAEDAPARVTIDYVLETDARTVGVELLGFGGATAEALVLQVDGAATDVRLLPASGTRLAAELPLPPPGADGRTRFVLSYEVAGAVERREGAYRVRLPVASVALPPPGDGADRVFSAAVRLPAGWSVTEGFPSGFSTGPGGTVAVDLAVVPAVVSFRGRTDGRSPPGLPLLLSLIGGAVLVGFCAAGWPHLRRMAS